MNEFPIDAVIAWVDGNDPAHRAKRAKYSLRGVTDNSLAGGDQRFVQFGEIRWCVASILRFAPYIRKIFIVTDGQDPQMEPFLDEHFPERTTQVEIIDHSVLFRGREALMPVFNCRSLECAFWMIPDLSEHFIYFNDDFVLCRPCPRDMFFDAEGRAVCYASWFSVPVSKAIRAWKRWRRPGVRASGFKDGMLSSAIQLGEMWRVPYIGHIPSALRRSVAASYFEAHPEVLDRQMSYRFRDPDQFNPQVLTYLLGLRAGACVMRSRRGLDMMMGHRVRRGYVARKLRYASLHPSVHFCCFNSLERLSSADLSAVESWLSSLLLSR